MQKTGALKEGQNRMATNKLSLVVPSDVRAFILDWARDSRGNGGFQSLYRLLADRLRHGKVLHLSEDEMERITRYATDYGDGGHQQTLRKLIAAWVAQHPRLFTGKGVTV